jgi:hypothetical protein
MRLIHLRFPWSELTAPQRKGEVVLCLGLVGRERGVGSFGAAVALAAQNLFFVGFEQRGVALWRGGCRQRGGAEAVWTLPPSL